RRRHPGSTGPPACGRGRTSARKHDSPQAAGLRAPSFLRGGGSAAQPAECLPDVDAALVDRLADDDACHARRGGGGLGDRVDVAYASHAAGDYHVGSGSFRKLYRGLDIWTGEHSVTRNIRVDEGAHPQRNDVRGNVEEVAGGFLLPAPDRRPRAPRVEPYRDAFRPPALHRCPYQLRPLDRRRTDDDASDRSLEQLLHVLLRADAAPRLDASRRVGGEPLDELPVGSVAERRVEVD